MNLQHSYEKATGYGRTDWVVFGPCSCDYEEYDCRRCEGSRRIVVAMGLTESEAVRKAASLNRVDPNEPSGLCPSCGAPAITWRNCEQVFCVGAIDLGEPHYYVAALVPVGTCASCQMEFTDWRGEEARTLAVQLYVNRALEEE